MKAWETIEKIEGRYGLWFYVIERIALTRDTRGRISEASYQTRVYNPEKEKALALIVRGSPGECLVAMTKAIHAKEKEG